MIVGQKDKRAIGTFSDHAKAEEALHELKASGFPMDKVSIVGHHIDRNSNIAGAEGSDRSSSPSNLGKHNRADTGAVAGAVAGATVGGLTGLLVGLGMVAIPGVGPVLLAGAEAAALATTFAGGAIGTAAGGIVGGLIGLGIPEDRAKHYSHRIDQGDYLVMVEGSEEEIKRSHAILTRGGINNWDIYDNTRDIRPSHPEKPLVQI